MFLKEEHRILPAHERLAELYTISRIRLLTPPEKTEQLHCLQVNASYCYEMARLQNQMKLAEQTSDTVWYEELNAQMLELRMTGKVSKRST